MECLYIDCDNISYKIIQILYERLDFSNIGIKKAFGDWSKTELKNWYKKCLDYGLEQVQCQNMGKKQSTDIKLTIDIVNDINNYDIEKIYLISSDSDFTHLCHHIRKNNIYLTVLTLNESIIQNYVDEYICLRDDLNKQNILEIIDDIFEHSNAISITTFKKRVKEYNCKYSYNDFEKVINENSNIYVYYKKYIVYIYDLLEDESKKISFTPLSKKEIIDFIKQP